MLRYLFKTELDNTALNALFAAAWPAHECRDFLPVLRHSLTYISAHTDGDLVGFVNVAWDGGCHAFLLDTTVHPHWQRRGVGRTLVRHAVDAARTAQMEWLHVDYLPHLDGFYRGCGFRPTYAGLIALSGACDGAP